MSKQDQLIKRNKQAGFTIIELLITTVIFSVILLLISYAVIGITRTYYRGIIESTTQNTTRLAGKEISQAMQFSSSAPSSLLSPDGNVNHRLICIGNLGIALNIGVQINSSNQFALREFSLGSLCSADIVGSYNNVKTFGKELLGDKMRLTYFSLTSPSSDLYLINLRVVYGDDDVLCQNSAGNCTTSVNNYPSGIIVGQDVICKGKTGSAFCADSQVDTVVQRRLTSLQLKELKHNYEKINS